MLSLLETAFLAEVADVLDPERWQSILRTHPDVSLTTEAEAAKTYPAPLSRWRIRYPQVSDERWARAKEVSLGRARQTDEDRRELANFRTLLKRIRRTERLIPREREVLELLLLGLSSREVAQCLQISVNTTRRHVYRAYVSLGARTLDDAATRLRTLAPPVASS